MVWAATVNFESIEFRCYNKVDVLLESVPLCKIHTRNFLLMTKAVILVVGTLLVVGTAAMS
jgi:hypothetical protein